MATPTQQQVHLDGALTNISVAYRNANYIAETVFPNVPVVKQSNKYFVFTKSDWFRDEAAPRAPGTRAQRVDYNLSASNYLCAEWAVAKGVPDEVVDNADTPLRPVAEAAEYVTDKMYLRKEILVAAIVHGNSQWSASATPSTLWSNDTSDPIGDVNTALDSVRSSIGRDPNKGVIGAGLWRFLVKHPDLIDRVKGAASPGSPAILTMQAIAALFELEQILVGKAVKDTGQEGATATRAYVWGNHLAICYTTNTPSLNSPSAGYVFQWGARAVNRYREDQEHQDIIEVTESFDQKLVASDAGYLLKSAA